MERYFMGLGRRNGNEMEAERTSNNEQPHGEREKIMSLSLFQEAEKSTMLQLSSGSFCGLSEAIGKAGIANGSGKDSGLKFIKWLRNNTYVPQVPSPRCLQTQNIQRADGNTRKHQKSTY